jgi:molybdenum cofactor cytidylyltransferase
LKDLRKMILLEHKQPVIIAGILLAAGAALRMGQSKLLLQWKDETLIHRAASIALEAGLDPVIVVTGANSQGISDAVKDLPVIVVNNPNWQSGQSTSIRVGIKALPERTLAAVFLLGDQPFVSPELIQKLLTTYLQTKPVILAPFVGDKRSNPVLFDHTIFDNLCQLQGDVGARSVFGKYPPAAMSWFDERILLDIDTPEDYARLVNSELSK